MKPRGSRAASLARKGWDAGDMDAGSYPKRIAGVYNVGGGPHFGSGLTTDTAAGLALGVLPMTDNPGGRVATAGMRIAESILGQDRRSLKCSRRTCTGAKRGEHVGASLAKNYLIAKYLHLSINAPISGCVLKDR
jgi:hypothetical protein